MLANVFDITSCFRLSLPCGGRQAIAEAVERARNISIHALRGEGDLKPCKCVKFRDISIHALRGEGDEKGNSQNRRRGHFNPRPPWGGRRCRPDLSPVLAAFQSTPSVGRATE